MTKALGDLRWRDHRSALWWLGLLYRRPRRFREVLEKLTRGRALLAGLFVVGHALPYLVIIAAVLRWVLFGLLSIPPREPLPPDASAVLFHATFLVRGIAVGIPVGIAVGIVFGIAEGIAVGIALGIAQGIAGGIAFGIAFGIPVGIAVGIAFGINRGIAEAIAVGIAEGIVVGIAFGIALATAIGIVFGIAEGIAFGIAVGIAGAITSLRVYYHPLHMWFVWPNVQARWYHVHPVSWDDLCSVPFPGLDRLLVAHTEASPEPGRAEIERLISSYPSQRGQALRAQTTMIARQAGAQQVLSGLDGIVAGLPEGDKGYLAQAQDVRKIVGDIAAAQRRLDAIDRPFMREPYASLVMKEIESFHGRISGFREPLASEFRAAADKWLAIARHQLSEIQSITREEPTPQVFRAGDPVDRAQEAFVPRMGVLGQLERQVMLASGCPGLLIYGRRRMGKSTLLRNLAGFVPSTVRIVSISMQNPAAFTSVSSLSRLIMDEVRKTYAARVTDRSYDLAGLYQLLDENNNALEDENKRMILAFDEFEQFDAKMADGTFTEDLLSTIRESVQMHRRLVWVFAGSHDISELKNAPWTSYFVSLRTVEVPPFSPAETRLLLTEPLKASPLFGEDEARRPRFDPTFWGENGIDWIQEETAGWPHLVQLLAGTAVDLVNEANAHRLDDDMLECAADRSIVDGDMVLRELMQGESGLPGEWQYLAGFRNQDEQPAPENEAIVQSLRRRQIIIDEGGTWRLRVPLMQRWLRQRG